MRRILILGGTGEARELAERLASRFHVILSLAGRTRAPILPDVTCRIGGFGGADGLARYLADQGMNAVIDATHPFAARISANAVLASARADVPLLVLLRPEWTKAQGDRWIEAADMAEAARLLGAPPRRVFLAVGRQELAPFAAQPQHDYLIRSVDPPELPPGLGHARTVLGRGPFAEADERDLLRDERIDIVVTKNSGGAATYGKIAAARALGLPVVMVRRPRRTGPHPFPGFDEVVAGLHALFPAERGE